jgi:hypothetical protein
MKLGKSSKLNQMKNVKKIIGYIFFGLSFVMWLVPAFVGFFSLPTKVVAFIITGAIVMGEVFFIVSIILLGKEFWNKIKRIFRFYWIKLSRKFS